MILGISKELFWLIFKVFLAALSYLVVAEIVILHSTIIKCGLSPQCYNGNIAPLPASEAIASVSGMVAAAGLTAIFLQAEQLVIQNKNAAEQKLDRVNEQRRQNALQANDLHIAFNSREMQENRRLAWNYLTELVQSKDMSKEFVLYWLSQTSGRAMPLIGKKEDQENIGWAISAMVAFFCRVESNFQIMESGQDPLPKSDIERITGPFYWNFWGTKLIALAETAQDLLKDPSIENIDREAYFIAQILKLRDRIHLSS